MQKRYLSSARCSFAHELSVLRRGFGAPSLSFSVSSSSREGTQPSWFGHHDAPTFRGKSILTYDLLEAEDSGSPIRSIYRQNFPPQSQGNSNNATRPSGPLLRRRIGPARPGAAVSLDENLGSDPMQTKENPFNTRPTQTTTVGDNFSLPISRHMFDGASGDQSNTRREGGASTSQLLRRRTGFPLRTGGAQSVGSETSRFRGQGTGRTGASRGGRGGMRGGKSDRPRRRREADAGDNEDNADIGVEMIYGPTPEPKSVPYDPKTTTMEELRLDWPATAIDGTGLIEGIQQRAESLANRIPHGFHTPQEIAERFQKGEMVHFESEAEQQEVLKIASELSKARADMLTDRKGEMVAPDDMSFAEIDAQEKKHLAATMIKGEYPELQKQSFPFLNGVVQQLRNNGTYHDEKMSQFMAKVQALLPPSRGPQRARQAQKALD